MKNTIGYIAGMIVAGILMTPAVAMAQGSLPAPGSGGAFTPAAPAGPPNGIGWNPGPNPAAPGWAGINNGWPSSWTWNPAPAAVVNPVIVNPNQGYQKVIACGYDSFGNWKVIPMLVSYQYNGIQYDVNVINAWNPITASWDTDIDMPAYNTLYGLRGVNYHFYTPLSTGTYYFNL